MGLRERQREHSFILLTPEEFAGLTGANKAKLPTRHREHFGRILRRKADWEALVGDGCGHLVKALVQGDVVNATGGVFAAPGQPQQTILVQAWIKQKALSLVLQKCCELGVTGVFLVDTDLSQPHSEKPERIRAICESACMQAYNPYMPAIEAVINLADLPGENRISFFGDLDATLKISKISRNPGQSAIFYNGPEGGWSQREVEWLRQKAQGVLLSENVLRAETAAIIAAGFLTLQ